MGTSVTLVAKYGNPTFSSLIVTGNTNLGDNLVVSGSITAQSLIVNTTSVYSGSTRFGDIITNTHQFTGSIFNSGSVTSLQFNGSGAGLTSIPNAALTNSTISGISLGSNLATLTIGTGLSGTSYNGSGAVTIANTITNNNQLTNGAGYITSAGSISGNAGSVTYLPGRTDSAAYPILWGAAYTNTIGTIAYSCAAVTIQSSTGTITATTFSGALNGNASTATSAGNATTAGGLAVHTGRNNEADKIVRTQANGYILCGYINSSNGNENNNSNADRVWGTNGSDDYLRTYRTSALSVSYAATAGSAPANGGTADAISQTVTVDTNANLVYANMASNDQFRIRVGGASNAGYAEIATADDGTEPIYVRQYTGVFSDIARTATLLDGSGNTSFPGNISGGYILGSYFNSSAGNSENPTIGQIWTQSTGDNYLRKSTPAHLISQLGLITTGNYSSYALPLSGGTISGNVTINGSTNTPLSINSTEPYMNIVANGGSNVAGLKIYPSTNYDAYIGNYGGTGKLWLIAGNADNAYVDSAGSLFNRTGTYGTISDITLKENIINATPKLQDLLKLKVRNFNFIGKNEKQLGFIAQEFEEVFPNAISIDTGFGNMNGKKVVKTTVLIPMLVKAIQEQQTLITELQEKLERNNIT